ncbi:hypothetical protein BIW11_06760 [Tropilaelaps mercedesae]|uniref:Ninjurin-1-like n=1 Tax=Tropilaelaps mercedesae TaxID=418985 RepID=A0A1V9XWM5_9ACAR|nr:hypothetical protein BIW11_06760 [Tropilaelaps mercedesae]
MPTQSRHNVFAKMSAVATYSVNTERDSASGGLLLCSAPTNDCEGHVTFEKHTPNNVLSNANRVELDKLSLTSKRMMIAGGFLDIALFTTNCEQLKFAIESQHLTTPSRFNFILIMLAVSLALQVVMAVLFTIMGFLTDTRSSLKQQRFINNIIMVLIALVTLLNIVISTFSNKGAIAKYCLYMQKEIAIYDGETIGNYTGQYINTSNVPYP